MEKAGAPARKYRLSFTLDSAGPNADGNNFMAVSRKENGILLEVTLAA